MKINSQTKISEILKNNQEALEAIVSISSHFTKLRNPLLRKVMAPRVNIAQAAKIGHCTIEDFYKVLAPFGFEINENSEPINDNINQVSEKPDWLIKAGKKDIIVLDVRTTISESQDPYNEIIGKTRELTSGQILCVVNTFEPAPIISILEKKGYKSFVEYIKEDEIYTYLKPGRTGNNSENKSDIKIISNEEFIETGKKFENKTKEVDVRNLDMPLPMLTILEELEQLPDDYALYVHHKKVPLYLIPELNERKFDYSICKISEDYYKLLISKI